MGFKSIQRLLLVAGLMAGKFMSALQAGQITLDNSLGQSGLSMSGTSFSLTPVLGKTAGNNLFFSFSQFNLAGGDVATFSGPNNIQNILSRVTGGSSSTIDGTIRSTISGANFFFINPSGIVFGPNAAIDVSGSFAASTASYLKLKDNARFMAAVGADDSTLSSAPVSAFGFLGSSPGSISVQQTATSVPLAVADGNTLSLVGGNISLNGSGLDGASQPLPTLKAAAGQINLVSVKSPGEVPLDTPALTVAQFGAAFSDQGQISLQNGARVDASGEAGGRIVIRGGSLTVDNSIIQANTTGSGTGQGIDVAVVNDLSLTSGGQVNSLSTLGLGAGGNINIVAQSVRLDGGGLTDDNFNPTTQISAATGDPFQGGGSGKGSDIMINTGSLELNNSAQISSASFGAGDAGNVAITASSMLLDARLTTPTQITANTYNSAGGGNAGNIFINTDTLAMQNGATILAGSFGSGQAGGVGINARLINILSGAVIFAGTFGSGQGGDVQIRAGTLAINGKSLTGGGPDSLTGIQAVTTSFDTPAPGGNIRVIAGSVEMSHQGSIFTTSYGIGPAGNIAVHSDGNIVLTDGSSVSTSAPGSSGGDISISAGGGIRLIDSQITAQAGLDGGNITVAAPGLIYLFRSKLSGEADITQSGFGNGGNLSINPSFLILNDSSLVSKSSFGNGGNITIQSDYFFQSTSLIDASAPFGLPGTVSVTAPNVDLSGSLVALPGNLLDLAAQLRPDCAVRLSGNASSFIMLGNGGLPVAPGGFVPSSLPAGGYDQK